MSKIRNLDRWVLYVYKSIKGGYREKHLDDLALAISGNAAIPTVVSRELTRSAVEDCVANGWLKKSASGAISLTSAGRELARERPYGQGPRQCADTWQEVTP